MTLSTQFLTMIAMVSGGFYLGIIQDTFRRFTPYWKERIVLKYVMEVCFWLTQTMILFYILFRVNGGELRVYIFAACLLGFAIYQVFAANTYKKLLEYIIRIITAIYRFIEKTVQVLIIAPIKWIIMLIVTIVLWVAKLLGSILLFIIKLIITPIKWMLQTIYGILPENFQLFLHKIAGFYSTMKNIFIKSLKYIKSKRR